MIMLKSGAEILGINLNQEQIAMFDTYFSILIEYNKKFNLTRITERDDVIIKHFLDSLTCAKYIPNADCKSNAKIADVGTGAGFPGIPLAIVRPDLDITLVDSLQKRVNFLKTVAIELNLPKVTCIHSRAEDLGKSPEYREQFDCTVSRAVANLSTLSEYNIPLIKPNGIMLAMKSKSIDDEIANSTPLIHHLGGSTPTIHLHTIPHSDIIHSIVIIGKKRKTPQRFPRQNKYIGTPVP